MEDEYKINEGSKQQKEDAQTVALDMISNPEMQNDDLTFIRFFNEQVDAVMSQLDQRNTSTVQNVLLGIIDLCKNHGETFFLQLLQSETFQIFTDLLHIPTYSAIFSLTSEIGESSKEVAFKYAQTHMFYYFRKNFIENSCHTYVIPYQITMRNIISKNIFIGLYLYSVGFFENIYSCIQELNDNRMIPVLEMILPFFENWHHFQTVSEKTQIDILSFNRSIQYNNFMRIRHILLNFFTQDISFVLCDQPPLSQPLCNIVENDAQIIRFICIFTIKFHIHLLITLIENHHVLPYDMLVQYSNELLNVIKDLSIENAIPLCNEVLAKLNQEPADIDAVIVNLAQVKEIIMNFNLDSIDQKLALEIVKHFIPYASQYVQFLGEQYNYESFTEMKQIFNISNLFESLHNAIKEFIADVFNIINLSPNPELKNFVRFAQNYLDFQVKFSYIEPFNLERSLLPSIYENNILSNIVQFMISKIEIYTPEIQMYVFHLSTTLIVDLQETNSLKFAISNLFIPLFNHFNEIGAINEQMIELCYNISAYDLRGIVDDDFWKMLINWQLTVQYETLKPDFDLDYISLLNNIIENYDNIQNEIIQNIIQILKGQILPEARYEVKKEAINVIMLIVITHHMFEEFPDIIEDLFEFISDEDNNLDSLILMNLKDIINLVLININEPNCQKIKELIFEFDIYDAIDALESSKDEEIASIAKELLEIIDQFEE